MLFNYLLNPGDYSFSNALSWGNCILHLKRSNEGHLGPRIFHILIGIAELPPVISQIVSIAEMKLAACLRNRPTPVSPLRQNDRHPARSPQGSVPSPSGNFERFKNDLIAKLRRNIESQQQAPTYLREPLKSLQKADRNLPFKVNQHPAQITLYTKNATLYAYNAERIRDYPWGCAWRAAQTCLSSYGITISLEELFHIFGPLENLTRIYEDKYPGQRLYSERSFAPYDRESGWAEPFVVEMVMHFYGISARLESIHGIPNLCSAPRSVFHNPPLTFAQFKERLENHFTRKQAAPVMIDDGLYSFNIIGIGRRDGNLVLWISDPHIKEGVNHSPTDQTPNGLYTVTLNAEGEQVARSLDPPQELNMFNPETYRGLNFGKKKWMILFPHLPEARRNFRPE